VTDRLIKFADIVLTMTEGHRQAIIENWPESASRTFVLKPDGSDIVDPIGSSLDVYRLTATQISDHLRDWADKIQSTLSNNQP
jgi:protein-tyrosine phosphatase